MIIKHKKFLDICFETFTGAPEGFFGQWVNMGYTKSWYIPVKPQWLSIKDKNDWEKLDETIALPKCLRYGKWIPL